MSVNSEDYINEVLHCMKELDVVKTEVLLTHIDQVDEKAQRRLIFELSRAEEQFSIAMLKKLIQNDIEVLEKVPALKQVLMSIFLNSPESLSDFLMDEGLIESRIFLIKLAGELRCDYVVSDLLTILNTAEEESLVLVILEVLGDIASSEGVNAISEYLYTANKRNIAKAIIALKKIGTGPAIQRLADRMGTDKQIDLLIIDAFAEIQDNVALGKLNETLVAHNAYIRTYGKSKLVKIGSKAIPILIENLLLDDPDLLIHTLNVLGDIGDESAVAPIRKLLFNEPKNDNVRFAAYETLGLLPMGKTSYTLAAGLSDPIDNVCTAAAKAINTNYSPMLSAGISNLLATPNENDQKRLIKTIIDSEADKIVLDQLDNDMFSDLAINYITNDIPESLLNFYINLFRKNANNKLADEILSNKKSETSTKMKVCAIDDSRMILGIYRSILHRMECESELYEFPEDAINAILETKPDIVFTDLNMPKFTGIDVVKKLREKYSKEELPIIMVTTQNEVNDTKDAIDAGVNIVIHKPFTEESLQASINEVQNG